MMADADTCVCCGKVIPEGYGLACHECKSKVYKPTFNLYENICNKLTDFEHSSDEETADSDWLAEFYLLLVQVQNSFECGEITI